MRLLLCAVVIAFCALNLLTCTARRLFDDNYAHYDRDFLSARELSMHESDNALDLIRDLRPQWLQGRGSKSSRYWQASYPVVYVNESRHGDIYSLSAISTQAIKKIKFFRSGEAATRFGLNHIGGAILIII